MMEKVNQSIKQNLFSTNTQTVITAINSIKEKGNKHYLPILFDLLNSNPEKEIEDEIKTLLSTVKDKETVTLFIDAINNKKYQAILKSLLEVCWQNGLDYSNYVPLFVDLIINEEWEIAFEAFTIIDNLEFLPEQEIIEQTKTIIEANRGDVNEQKAYFLQEVLNKLS